MSFPAAPLTAPGLQGFHDTPRIPGGSAHIPDFEFLLAYDVRGGSEYVRQSSPQQPEYLVMWRTLEGRGLVRFGQRPVEVAPDTVLLMRSGTYNYWHPLTPCWRFWSLHFRTPEPPPFPFEQPVHVAPHGDDASDFASLFEAVGSSDLVERRFAVATLQRMIYRWAATLRRAELVSEERLAVEDIVARMQGRIRQGWSVAEMAQAAGMTERRFYRLFQQVTGKPPYRYFLDLRLAVADSLLRMGGYGVGEVAERVGFGDPFQFSKAYRRRYGMPPSAAQTGAGAPGLPSG
jgi:AraC-like DNA-binding protein